MSLLEQDTTRKEQVKIAIKPNNDNSKEYKVEVICDSEVYVKKSDSTYYLPSLYYLILWKGYSKKKNTCKLILAIEHFWSVVTTFYHDYLNKQIVIFPLIFSIFPMPIDTVKPKTWISKKRDRLIKANGTSKHSKKI